MSYFKKIQAQGQSTGTFFPMGTNDNAAGVIDTVLTDMDGSVIARSATLTDEGSILDPFSGVALDARWVSVIGSGGSISVANSICSIVSGSTANAFTCIHVNADYAPIDVVFTLAITNRRANQDIYFGLVDMMVASPYIDSQGSKFHITGTDNTKIRCVTQSAAGASGTESGIDILLPSGFVTTQTLQYRISYAQDAIRFYVGLDVDHMILIATRSKQLPGPYTVLSAIIEVINGATPPAGSSTINIDTFFLSNHNTLDTKSEISGYATIDQNVLVSVVNSSVTPLAPYQAGTASDMFTGQAELTTGVNSIQVCLFTTTNCSVYIDQSPNGVNWDISDLFDYHYQTNPNFGITVQAVSSYFRVRVQNLSSSASATPFRLQSILCPMAEPLPRALSEEGNLKCGIYEIEDAMNNIVKISSSGSLSTIIPTRIVGVALVGNVIDPSWWTSDVSAGGTYTQGNTYGSLTTNTTANGASTLQSIRYARAMPGYEMHFQSNVDFGATPASNIKRWGVFASTFYNFTITAASATIGAVYSNNGQTFTVLATIVSATTLTTYGSEAPSASGTLTLVSGTGAASITFSAAANQNKPSNGAMFEMLDGPYFSVSLYKAGVRYKYANNGSFGGDYGSTLDAFPNTINKFSIRYSQVDVYFEVNNQLLHHFDCRDDAWSEYLTLPIRAQNVNHDGGTTNSTLKIGNPTIQRMGPAEAIPTYKYISTSTTTVCKFGAGSLHRILNGDNIGTATIYDSVTAAGPIIAIIDLTRAVGTLEFQCPFFFGLTIVTAGSPSITVILE